VPKCGEYWPFRDVTIVHRMKIGPQPNQLACTLDGRWVYVPCNDGNYWVIDGKLRTVFP
jgi:hypothetical protein